MLVVIFVISKAVPPKQHDITNTFDLIKKAVQHHLNFLQKNSKELKSLFLFDFF
jgi:hypothetical protein